MHRPYQWLVVLVALVLTLGLTACEQQREDTLPTDPQVGEGEQVLTPGAEGTDGDGIAVVTDTTGVTTTDTTGVTTTTPITGTTVPTDTTGVTTTLPVTPTDGTTPVTETVPTDPNAPPAEATTVAVPDGGTGEAPTGTQTYTVQAGDSLYSIAVAYGTSVENLIALNNLDPNNTTLTVGQTLTVPGTATGEAPAETAAPTAVPPAAPTAAPQQGTNASGQRTHTVQQGEWIYAIARLYGVDPQAIINANPSLGGNPNNIYPGQVLIIP